MSVVIRLKRFGTTKKPCYRVVVADKRSPRDGGVLEEVGQYHPRVEPSHVKLDIERINYWVKTGAQLSVPVMNLVKKYNKNK